MSKRTGSKQAARVVREQLARERRRRRALWTSVVAAVVLLLAGLAGWAVVANDQPRGTFATPAAVSRADDSGIAIGSGPVSVDIYADFICPACRQFEEVSAQTVTDLLAEGKITLVFHPVAFLDRTTSTEYSTRASAASACAPDGDTYRKYATALFANQPPEGGAGLSDDELIRIAGTVGLTGEAFTRCARDGTYRPWTAHVTEVASQRGVSGTPTILVA
ncbi:MAG TPA: thioredoxin domain-containing protein, partial [Pilimelia sp.]|nr:thioredoxin domain-containing protein [Pilimelia sp.]